MSSTTESIHEHAEHAHEPFDKRVAATMAVIAAILAVVSVFSHLFTTEELINQQRASDQWSFYQAKNIRRYESEIARDMLQSLAGAKAGTQASQYSANAERYKHETEQIQEKAQEFENESHLKTRQALRLDFGEIFLELAIVFASLAILSKRRMMYWVAIAGGIIGAGIAATTLMVH